MVTERRASRASGYSLTDLLVALALVGLLAGLTVPAYRDHVLRAHRADARAALLALATAEEIYYLACGSYAAVLDDSQPSACSTGRVRYPSTAGGYLVVVTEADVQAWTATATAVRSGPQASDRRCQVFRLTSTGTRTASDSAGDPNDIECWSR